MRDRCNTALLELPEALMKAARKELRDRPRTPARPRRAASLALRAVAIAVLRSRPLRLANIIGLHLDRHLQRDDPGRPDIHRVQIQAAETKNDNAITLPVPPRLTDKGFSEMIFLRSRARFGTGFRPHRFRHAACTTAAVRMPEYPNLAADLLGISADTVEQSYNRAGQVHAANMFDAIIDQERPEPDRPD